MRWRWWRRQRKDRSSSAELDRADRAVQLSREQAAEAKLQLAEDQRLADRFRALRQQNHFAEAFSRALREGR